MTLEARIEAAKIARRAAIAARDHVASAAAMKLLSSLAAEKSGVQEGARFDPKMIKALNNR